MNKRKIAILLLIGFVISGFPSFAQSDTLHSFLVRKDPCILSDIQLHHRDARLGNKMFRGFLYSSAYNATIGLYLLAAPDYVTKWSKKDKFQIGTIEKQYGRSYSQAPVIDHDLAIIDYLGHPYQGAYYYNSIRSQGATALQSALFAAMESTLWEYVWEGGMEQPSIQDLIVTPVCGSLLGEATHVLTLKMSRNGFTWYEKVIVTIINPSYVLNNGFKVKHSRL